MNVLCVHYQHPCLFMDCFQPCANYCFSWRSTTISDQLTIEVAIVTKILCHISQKRLFEVLPRYFQGFLEWKEFYYPMFCYSDILIRKAEISTWRFSALKTPCTTSYICRVEDNINYSRGCTHGPSVTVIRIQSI